MSRISIESIKTWTIIILLIVVVFGGIRLKRQADVIATYQNGATSQSTQEKKKVVFEGKQDGAAQGAMHAASIHDDREPYRDEHLESLYQLGFATDYARECLKAGEDCMYMTEWLLPVIDRYIQSL